RPAAPVPPFADRIPTLALGRPVLVAGSWADEEVSVLVEARASMRAQGTDPFLIVAPRRIESFEMVASRLENAGLATLRRTRLAPDALAAPLPPADVLVLDSVGELAGAYALGCVAILGGTFAPKGGHNVLEPLRCGVPTIVGPSTENIAGTLAAAQGAVFPVSDASSLAAAAVRLVGDPALRQRAARAAEALFLRHAGATARSTDAALTLLDASRARRDTSESV
ncbi:MAG: hypothetical protein ABIT01_19955, partial [Thermoanaerobaculia bacterium]